MADHNATRYPGVDFGALAATAAEDLRRCATALEHVVRLLQVLVVRLDDRGPAHPEQRP
jgi:hypothetical protein